MRVPRFRIAWVMILIAIVALNLGAFRAVSADRSSVSVVLPLGSLPMANVLAIGLLVGYRRPGSRGFFLGFAVIGAAALAVYVAVIVTYQESISIYFVPVYQVLRATIGPPSSTPRVIVTYYVFAAVWATWPQLVLALIGGSLTRYNDASRTSSSVHQPRSATRLRPDSHSP
jgi:hypothetical protein